MEQEQLFSLALGLIPPWLVDGVRFCSVALRETSFSAEEKRLDLHIDFPRAVASLARSVVRSAPSMTRWRSNGGTWIFSNWLT